MAARKPTEEKPVVDEATVVDETAKKPTEEKPEKSVATGTQHMRLISREENGMEVRALDMGGIGILVAYGLGVSFSIAFVPHGDIKELPSGLCIG